MEGLLDAGITCIINLMRADEVGHDGKAFTPYAREFRERAAKRGLVGRWLRLPIRDVSVPTREHMAGILDAVDLAHDAHRGVLVHCWGGRGRTGTVVGCWLARHGHVTGQDALDRIEWLRRTDPTAGKPSPETHEQREFVRRWGVGY
ncbi:MAG: dual specificity protein phosphatase family protein [Armatimonadetes bacterium]|nr:dual specificity protein phosphatase family protein [Armatimonadota bacterium]